MAFGCLAQGQATGPRKKVFPHTESRGLAERNGGGTNRTGEFHPEPQATGGCPSPPGLAPH
jgi:hypothetical protein